jgi:hypothetical protein
MVPLGPPAGALDRPDYEEVGGHHRLPFQGSGIGCLPFAFSPRNWDSEGGRGVPPPPAPGGTIIARTEPLWRQFTAP